MTEITDRETVRVNGRDYKIHRERGGSGDRWIWRYEAGGMSINAVSRAELIERLKDGRNRRIM